MTKPLIHHNEELVAVLQVSQQTGFDSSAYFTSIRPINSDTTVGEILKWVNGHKHTLGWISLQIQPIDLSKEAT
jgi:hypothetical protein